MITAVALVAIAAVAAEAAAAAASAPPASLPPALARAPMDNTTLAAVARSHRYFSEVLKPPPRQPAWQVKPEACLARYRATGNAPAYLCCIDRSMGFCVGRLAYTTAGGICTLDWTPLPGGRQCCVARSGSVGGVRWYMVPPGLIASRNAPPLSVTCRSVGKCPLVGSPARTRAPEDYVQISEFPGRCGSWAPKVYKRCERTLCAGSEVRRPVRSPPPSTSLQALKEDLCKWFGTKAQCCLIKEWWWQRVKCCRECSLPVWGRRSWGCCWAGPRPL